MSDPVMRDLFGRYAASMLKQHIDWYNSPMQKAWREKAQQEWLALPWYVRAWRVTRSRVHRARIRCGEWIAGRSFDD